jgi:NhaB family Na+:H+ antiporter
MKNLFLGSSPKWFKLTIIVFLIINPIAFWTVGSFVTGWLLLAEFIFTLAMALKCYPLQSGGLLALEALLLGLTNPESVSVEITGNLEVILLLVFMVAGIYFMKPLLMYIFSKLFIKVQSKLLLAVFSTLTAAILSAFLDALTVMAVLIGVTAGFYSIYHKIHSSNKDYNIDGIPDRIELSGEVFLQFKRFLQSIVMHGAVGTALGGVCTLVGEPQNLLIGEKMGWNFVDFFLNMSIVTVPVLFCGLITTVVLELTGWFGFRK